MHRYILEPYHGRNSRFMCPQCHQKHRVTRYIDTETQNHLADHVGKCDRIDRCGYHYPPRDYFASGGTNSNKPYKPTPVNENIFDTLPREYLDATVKPS